VRTGLELTGVAPQLLGADRPRTYLLLFQNEDELRATGGFVSAVGRATIDAGKIISLTVEDSYAVDDFTTPYPDAPAPMLDYMGIDLWVLRDSNWSPDFPVAARQAISLYTQTRGGTIDGVIALNQQVVEALVDGLGPLTIDGRPSPTRRRCALTCAGPGHPPASPPQPSGSCSAKISSAAPCRRCSTVC